MSFTANITVKIEHRSGPAITSPRHVAAWLIEDSAAGIEDDYLELQVCTGCPDPEECVPGCPAPVSTYRVFISTVDSIEADG